LIAATTGFALSSISAITSRLVGVARARSVPNSVMSAPPEKIRTDPVSTTAITDGSASARPMPSATAARTAYPRPLTGGLSISMIATSPSTRYSAAISPTYLPLIVRAVGSPGRLTRPGRSHPIVRRGGWPGDSGGRLGQPHEVGHPDLFPAGRGVDAGGAQPLFGARCRTGPAGQGGAQGLAALGEGGVDDREHRAAMLLGPHRRDAVGPGRAGVGVDAHQARLDLGHRPEHRSAHRAGAAHLTEVPGLDARHPVDPAARFGGEP